MIVFRKTITDVLTYTRAYVNDLLFEFNSINNQFLFPSNKIQLNVEFSILPAQISAVRISRTLYRLQVQQSL